MYLIENFWLNVWAFGLFAVGMGIYECFQNRGK